MKPTWSICSAYFGLTEAEAEVMKAYSEGASAPQIAEISGRSLEDD